MKKCVFAGSFDPITIGHERMIEISSQMFDEVIVALCINENKVSFFSQELKMKMLQRTTEKFSNVKVVYHEGLLMDLLKKEGAKYNIRGIRSGTDFDYENKMLEFNKNLYPEHITLYIPCEKEYLGISSTVVRERIKNGLSLDGFVSKEVIEVIEER